MPMATAMTPIVPSAHDSEGLLEAGDCLSRDEFERRYERMRHVKKAELIEGIVYMPSPARHNKHGKPQLQLAAWVGTYASETLGSKRGQCDCAAGFG